MSKQTELANAATALRERGATQAEIWTFFRASAAAMQQGTGLGGAEIVFGLGHEDEE